MISGASRQDEVLFTNSKIIGIQDMQDAASTATPTSLIFVEYFIVSTIRIYDGNHVVERKITSSDLDIRYYDVMVSGVVEVER